MLTSKGTTSPNAWFNVTSDVTWNYRPFNVFFEKRALAAYGTCTWDQFCWLIKVVTDVIQVSGGTLCFRTDLR